jgi:predicted transcriptional regulator
MATAFYIQEEWITNYKLSGNDLLIFARLASFTLNVGGYNGSIEWLGHSVGTTKRTAINVLEKLEKIGMIERENKFIKCVFQPLIQGEKSALKGEEISPKYNKEYNYTNKCSDSVIDSEHTHTLTHTENFLFDFFKSKIQSATDESCIRNLAKKFANIEQAKLFAEFCEERKTNLHLGMITKLFNEIFDRACEWDAQGRPRRVQKQPEQPPQPQPQMLPQRENAEISANSAENSGFSQWMAQVIDVIKEHPKFAKKPRIKDYSIAMQVTEQFPTPCDIEKINEYLNAI